MQLRLQPIYVYCFHHVSDAFNPNCMIKEDWTQTEQFKRNILYLKQRYTFISLPEAHQKMKHDWFRFRKYAVLTADDGNKSLLNILPWIAEQRIPITLFLNPAYFDGKHFRDRETEQYLSAEDVWQITEQCPLVTIASHGWRHVDASKQNIEEFYDYLQRSVAVLQQYPHFIPFYAYAWGRCTRFLNQVLIDHNYVPVYISGHGNYNANGYVDRMAIDNRDVEEFLNKQTE